MAGLAGSQREDQGQIQEIDALVSAQIDPHGPGLALAVVKHGEPIHRMGYGMANLEWKQPIGPDTVLALGSLTKPFTAQAVLLLAAEGKLRLDDPLTDHLPDYPDPGQRITVAHLLTHTSGIPNFITRPGYWERESWIARTPQELPMLFAQLLLDFAPGERYSYSNSAYCLLGLLIEQLSGMTYGDFVRARIFAPLGMTHSHYLRHEAVIPRRAAGYEPVAGGADGYEHARYLNAAYTYSAGALGSTLEDLILWDRALHEHRLLDAATQERMQTPVRLTDGRTAGYGLGWGLSTYRGRQVVHHAGGVPGFSSFFGRFVDEELTVIVLSNVAGFDAAGLAAQVSNLALELPAPAHTPVALDASALDRAVGSYADFIGERLEIARDGDALIVTGDLEERFLPSGATTFYAADAPDIHLRFERVGDDVAGPFTRVTAVVPFYWFTADRVAK
jgi:CubicO group peptidase (beta-lactamase class C family)